jgi:hypothetical protein
MNRDLQPVLQHFHVCFPRGSGSNMFKSGISFVLDAYRQSTTPIYAVFGRNDRMPPTPPADIEDIINFILS